MYQTIKSYQTADGQSFLDAALAEEHALELLSSELEIILKGAFQGEHSASVDKAVKHLMSDPAHLRAQVEALLELLKYHEKPRPAE